MIASQRDSHQFKRWKLSYYFIPIKAMVTFEWIRAISLEAKKNSNTKIDSVSEDDFRPRGHKPIPKTPKEPIVNQHIKNAHLDNVEAK